MYKTTVFDLHKNYLKNLFQKRNAEIITTKENLEQVNPQLYEWLEIFNSRFSDTDSTTPSTESQEGKSKSIEDSYANPQNKPKNKAHEGVKYWYKFFNSIVLDGVGYDVTFNIRDKGKEQYEYLIEFKKNGTSETSNTVYKDLLRTYQMSRGQNNTPSAESQEGKRKNSEREFTDTSTGEKVKFSIRQEAPPQKTLKGYKVFVVKDGKLNEIGVVVK